jgi:hypothetical protein
LREEDPGDDRVPVLDRSLSNCYAKENLERNLPCPALFRTVQIRVEKCK